MQAFLRTPLTIEEKYCTMTVYVGAILLHYKSERKYITMNKVKTAVIGLGCRGYSVMADLILNMDNAEVVAATVVDKNTDL